MSNIVILSNFDISHEEEILGDGSCVYRDIVVAREEEVITEFCESDNNADIPRKTIDARLQCDLLRPPPPTFNIGQQCSLLKTSVSQRWGVQQFRNDPRAIQYYTGFDDYDHFLFFLGILWPAANELYYKTSLLSTEDHLFLTLIKLRQAKEDLELSLLFKVSESTYGFSHCNDVD